MFDYLWNVAAGLYGYVTSLFFTRAAPKKKLQDPKVMEDSDTQHQLKEEEKSNLREDVNMKEPEVSAKVPDTTPNNADGGRDEFSVHGKQPEEHEASPVTVRYTPPQRLEHPTRQRPKLNRARQSLSPRSRMTEEAQSVEEKEVVPQTIEEEHVVPKEEDESPPPVVEDPVPIRRPAGAVALPGIGGIKFDPSAVKLKKSTPTSSPSKEEAAPVDFRSILKKTPTKTEIASNP